MKVSKVVETDLEKGLSTENVKLMKIRFSSCRFPTLCIPPWFHLFLALMHAFHSYISKVWIWSSENGSYGLLDNWPTCSHFASFGLFFSANL